MAESLEDEIVFRMKPAEPALRVRGIDIGANDGSAEPANILEYKLFTIFDFVYSISNHGEIVVLKCVNYYNNLHLFLQLVHLSKNTQPVRFTP